MRCNLRCNNCGNEWKETFRLTSIYSKILKKSFKGYSFKRVRCSKCKSKNFNMTLSIELKPKVSLGDNA